MGAELYNPGVAEPAPLIRQLCRYLSERSPQPMVAVEGVTHIVIYVNPAFARLVGRKGEDLIGRPFAEAVPEGDGNGCLALLDRVFRNRDGREPDRAGAPPGPSAARLLVVRPLAHSRHR